MNTENWTIEYFFTIGTGNTENNPKRKVISLSEVFSLTEGYSKRFEDWREAVRESLGEGFHYGTLDEMLHPVYHIQEGASRQGTSIKLVPLTVEGKDSKTSIDLPLHSALQMLYGNVLLSQEHPITLIAPDGTKYTATQI